MLARLEGDGVRLVLVEDASRLARSVLVAELAILELVKRGVRVVTASGEDLTDTDDASRVMIRQVGACFAQFEKARLVAKLRGARDRKSRTTGRRIEGRKSYAALHDGARAAARALAKEKHRSLREIASELAARGYMTGNGTVLSPTMVRRLLA
jgi:DNA invertase Pin-like site-specific DNA recombinase